MSWLLVHSIGLVRALPPLGQAEGQNWQPPIRTVTRLVVRAELIGVRPDGTQQLASGTVEAAHGQPGQATFPLDFRMPAGDRVTELRLTVDGTSSPSGVRLFVTTIVQASMPGRGSTGIRREREAQVAQGGSFLHQVYESPDHESSLVLTLTPETREVPEFVRPTGGSPVLFRVRMCRVTENGDVDLENNILRTLDNNPVSYSFKTTSAQSAPVIPPPPAGPPSSAPTLNDPAGDEPTSAPPQPATAPATPPPPPAPPAASTALPASAPAPPTPALTQPAAAPAQAASAPVPPAAVPPPPGTAPAAPTSTPARPDAAPATPTSVPSPPATAPASPDAAPAAPTSTSPRPGGGPATPASSPAPPTSDPAAPTSSPAPPTPSPAPSVEGEEIELTLTPKRSSDGLLLVEATLRRRGDNGQGDQDRSEIVRKTGVLSPGSVLEITVGGTGPKLLGAYRFLVLADF